MLLMFPTHPLRRGSGTRKLEIAPPLAFLPLGKPGGLWQLEIALFFTSTVLKLEAGSWKLEIAPYEVVRAVPCYAVFDLERTGSQYELE